MIKQFISAWRPRMAASPGPVALLLATALVVALTGLALAATTFQDINPDTSTVAQNVNATSGGRVNGMDVAPGGNSVAYAASEWGGIYKTTDGGANWAHLSGHMPQATWDVKVNPGNANRVYATSFYDGRTASISGIQVSTDAGTTWVHPASADPPFGQCAESRRTEPSAFGISVRPDATQNVVIGTNCGVAISNDNGDTWTFVDVTPASTGNARDVWDVEWQADGSNGIIDVCGAEGHQRSTDGGGTWESSTTNPLPGGFCSLATSPLESGVLYAMAGGNALYEGLADGDGIIQWTQLCGPASPSAPCNQGLGTRIEFVVTNQTGDDSFDLYIGASTSLFQITGCDNTSTPRCPANTRGSNVASGAHADPGDLVFDPSQSVARCPLFYSNDGGIYKNASNTTPGCLSVNSGWNRSMVGLHATWLWGLDVAQLAAGGPGVYFGLQDDGFWGSSDAGANWANPECCDVFDAVSDGNVVVYSLCCFITDNMGNPVNPSTFLRSRPANNPGGGFTAIYDNTNLPPSGWLATFQTLPSMDSYAAGSFVFVTQTNASFDPPGGNGAGGVFVTTNTFTSTTQLTGVAPGPATPPGACGVQASVSGGTPTFYVLAGNCNGFGGQLWSYTGAAAGGTWTRADTGLTQVGTFAVDPNDPMTLYASDLTAGGPRMVFSTDGGGSWDPDPELDAMMTQNGAFNSQTLRGPTNFTNFGGYTQPSLLAYSATDGDVLVAGGRNSGVFLSVDGGDNWGLLTDPISSATSGIPHLPRPWYAYFDHTAASDFDIYVGTVGRGVWRIAVNLPTANAGGPYETDEGQNVTLDGAGSSDPDGASLSYAWDLDNDGDFDDATGPTPVFDMVGQDGVFTVRLKVSAGGAYDIAETTLTVNNVAPTVSLASDAPVDEGSPVTVSGTISDPGWLDPLTATIDWGDGTPVENITGMLENERPDATLTFDISHVYGDNGDPVSFFTAEVCGSDDDTTTCETIFLQVDNVNPTAEIDETGTVLINGNPTFLAHAGEPIDFSGRSTDPGSDDLFLSWDWDDGPPEPDVTTDYLVNPPNPDPFPSPSIQPRDVIDMQTHAFDDACLYLVVFSALDDDGGTGEDDIQVLIVGNADELRTAGYWLHQYRGNGKIDFTAEELDCYLEIVRYVSLIFDEDRDLSTFEDAVSVLFVPGNKGSMEEIFDRQLLAAWLNFANGAVEWDQILDTDGDGAPDTAFSDVMAAAEAVRLDPAHTREALEAQKDILERINEGQG